MSKSCVGKNEFLRAQLRTLFPFAVYIRVFAHFNFECEKTAFGL